MGTSRGTRQEGTAPPALYPRLLGVAWYELAAAVRRAHLNPNNASLCGTGSFRVCHGDGRRQRLLARLLRVPCATEAANVRLVVTPLARGERWVRRFDGRSLVTTQWEARGGGLLERVGPLELRFRLEVRAGALVYRQVGAALRVGPLHFPLPWRVAPRVEAREEPDGANGTHVQVFVTLPWAGLLVSYEGEMKPRTSQESLG